MKVSEKVLGILDGAEIEENKLRLVGQLDRKDYVEVNKVLEAMGGKWNKKEKAHLFDNDVAELIDDMFTTGEVVDKKKELGFFPTPDDLAKKIVGLADIAPQHRVLEPSAGEGNILRAIGSQPDKVAVEINPDMVKKLACAGVSGLHIVKGDFLCETGLGEFDRVVMNPPFGKQQDIDHVLHAWKFLKPGGRLVSIMAAGVAFRQNKKTVAFREFVNENGYIENLPEGAFKTSGTAISTVLVVINKEA